MMEIKTVSVARSVETVRFFMNLTVFNLFSLFDLICNIEWTIMHEPVPIFFGLKVIGGSNKGLFCFHKDQVVNPTGDKSIKKPIHKFPFKGSNSQGLFDRH